MARFHTIEVEIDGLRYAGSWQMMAKGSIEVSCPHGEAVVRLGRYDPDSAARTALEDIVKTWLKARSAL